MTWIQLLDYGIHRMGRRHEYRSRIRVQGFEGRLPYAEQAVLPGPRRRGLHMPAGIPRGEFESPTVRMMHDTN